MSNEKYKSNKIRHNKVTATNKAVQCEELPVSRCYATLADAYGNDIKISKLQGRVDHNTFFILFGKDKTFKVDGITVDARVQNRIMMAGHGISQDRYIEVFGKLEDPKTIDELKRQLKDRNLEIDYFMADYMGNITSKLFITHMELVRHCFAPKCQVTAVFLNSLRGRKGIFNTPCVGHEYQHHVGVDVLKPTGRTSLTPKLAKSYDHIVELTRLSFGCGVRTEITYRGAYFDKASDHQCSGSHMMIFTMIVDKTVDTFTENQAKKTFKAIRNAIGYSDLQYQLDRLEQKYFQMYSKEA